MTHLKLAASIAAALVVSSATAAPIVLPGAIPLQPLFTQFVDAEQTSLSNNIGNAANPAKAGLAAGAEGNWGIMQLTNIVKGTALNPIGSDIQGGGTPIFADQILPAGAQILGIFYGATFTSPLTAKGGSVDLYWWDNSSQNVGAELANGANLAKRTAQNQYTGFTCAAANTANCTFLVHLDFVTGVVPGDTVTTISSNVTPGTADGVSKSYLNVDPNFTNGSGQKGFWANQLDTNFFTLDPLNNPFGFNYPGISFPTPRDLRLDNNFTINGAGAWFVGGTDITGLRSDGPARTASTPEPGSLALFGLAAALFGGLQLRRRNKA